MSLLQSMHLLWYQTRHKKIFTCQSTKYKNNLFSKNTIYICPLVLSSLTFCSGGFLFFFLLARSLNLSPASHLSKDTFKEQQAWKGESLTHIHHFKETVKNKLNRATSREHP